MARRGRRSRRSMSEGMDESAELAPSNVFSGAVGGAEAHLPALFSREIGLPQVTSTFTITNDRDAPSFLLKDLEFWGFARLDSTVNPPTAATRDAVGAGLVERYLPLLVDMLSRTSGTVYVPTQQQLVQYFAAVEEAIQILRCIIALRQIYKWDWSMFPPNVGTPPDAVLQMGTLFELTDAAFEITWSEYFLRCSTLVCLPGMKGMIERAYSPFTFDPSDSILKCHITDFQTIITNQDLSSYATALDAAIQTCTVTLSNVHNWLTRFVPWRVGRINDTAYVADPLLSHLWWNGSVVSIGDVELTGAAGALDTRSSLLAGNGNTVVSSNATINQNRFAMVGAYGGRMTLWEQAFIPFYEVWFNGVDYTFTLLSMFESGKVFFLPDNGVGSWFRADQLDVNSAAWTAANKQLFEYASLIENRYTWRPTGVFTAGDPWYDSCPKPLDGQKHPDLRGVQVFTDQVRELMKLGGALLAEEDIVRKINVATGASLIREGRQSLIDLMNRA